MNIPTFIADGLLGLRIPSVESTYGILHILSEGTQQA